MAWQPPSRPAWVERINAHGLSTGDPAHLVSLNPVELLDTACHSTGLDDFGDPGWRQHYDELMHALEEESSLNLVGRVMVRHDVLLALQNRLRLTDLWAKKPDILQQEIRDPVFIVGSARTGTTLLHELFDKDPAVRTPHTWEMYHPVQSLSGKSLVDTTGNVVKSLYSTQPEYGTIHYSGAELPNECIFLTNPMFLGEYWSGSHVVPSYERYMLTASHTPAYAFHKRMLQTLNHRLSSNRWVLKSPTHLGRLQELLAAYPDARIIQTHRDPLSTIPSVLSMMATLKWIRCNNVNVEGMAGVMSRGIARLYRQQIEARISGELPDEAFIDIRYADLVADPVGAVGGIYERLGWRFSEQARAAMRARLSEGKREGEGKHRYSPLEMGLDLVAERQQWAFYQERFEVPCEW